MATAARGSRDIVLRLEPEATAARQARRALLDAGMEDELGQTVALLTTEIVGNAVRHAGLRPGQHIELVARVSRHEARVEVRDEGACFEPSRTRGDGYGMRLLARLAARWGVEGERGCRVWFEVTSPRSPDRP
jgi:anti-sigma regulatory factor (Ser/Thr protein kinase)